MRDCHYRVIESQYAEIVNELQTTLIELLRVLERKMSNSALYRRHNPAEQCLLRILNKLQCISYKFPDSVGYKKSMRNEVWSCLPLSVPPAITLNAPLGQLEFELCQRSR